LEPPRLKKNMNEHDIKKTRARELT
jgi:hypothetical protein